MNKALPPIPATIIEQNIKAYVVETIVKELMTEFEAKAREKVQEAVDKVTVEALHHVYDVMNLREWMHVTFSWRDQKKK